MKLLAEGCSSFLEGTRTRREHEDLGRQRKEHEYLKMIRKAHKYWLKACKEEFPVSWSNCWIAPGIEAYTIRYIWFKLLWHNVCCYFKLHFYCGSHLITTTFRMALIPLFYSITGSRPVRPVRPPRRGTYLLAGERHFYSNCINAKLQRSLSL